MKKNRWLTGIAFCMWLFLMTAGWGQGDGSKELVLNGSGPRSKFPIGTVYIASLQVPRELKGKKDLEIIQADLPMTVILLVDTRMLTRERFIEAIREGFAKSASAGYPTNELERFVGYFEKVEIKKGDEIQLSYDPKTGLTVAQKPQGESLKTLGTIEGLAFKKALYAVWIGPKPVQDSLKKAMLGQ